MFEDTESSLSCVSSFGETFGWKQNDAKEDVSTRVIKNTTQLSPSAFKVYNKISEKNRYVPRQWTQEEFEAALPERFKEKNKICFAGGNIGLITAKNEEEIDLEKDKEQVALSSEDSPSIPSLAVSCNPPQRTKEVNEKISGLKAVFESVENKDDYDQLTSTNNDIEESKESQTQVLLLNEESPKQDTTTKSEITECEATQTHCNTFSSFLNACLQCLLNVEQFVQILANVSSRNKACSSFDIGKLQDLLNTVPSFNKSGQEPKYLYAKDVFLQFYDEVAAQSKSCDEALNILLETLIEKTTNLRPVLQGKFCHATTCENCETVVREYETFIFLNPTSPPPSSTDKRTLDINLFPCADGLWRITSRQISLYPGMKIHDLKEQLIGYPEFSETCDTSSIQIGEVENSRLDKVFGDAQEITELRLDPDSSLFAFQVMKSQPNAESSDMKDTTNVQGSNSRSYGFADMSYHLYFNCGLCLSDGKEVGLLMHRSCGGMLCRDCLDEISQSNSDRELCPCPICERPIDMEKELCATKINAETEARRIQPDVVCAVVFRANKPCNENTELFGCPAIVSIPQQTTGYQLYRCVGYLLPKALPMKEKTSFTLHKVSKTGLRCSTCSLATCTGCLIRIDDSVTIAPDTYLAVHFDKLADKSKENFEIKTRRSPHVPQTQLLFDGILRSCVEASSCQESLCPNCFLIGKTTSSITEFPQLLVIHLNRQYANTGIPKSMTIADVERFFVLERENACQEENSQGLTYQLTAAVLGEKSSTAATYRPCLPGFGADKWLLYDDFQVDEIDPTLLFLTSESVLFYEPIPMPREYPEIVGHLLKRQSTAQKDDERNGLARDSSNDFVYDIYCKDTLGKLATIAEDQATDGYSRKPSDSKLGEKQNKDHYLPEPYSGELEPGECFLGDDYDQNRPFRESDVVYGSQLSLGEIKEEHLDPSCKAIPGTQMDGIDTISPISTTDAWKNELRIVRETRRLVKAVKREDAYGIVCSLKKGADPCLLINDVSALHLAVGIKSDQRRSIVIYLLKYSRDVNVPTADGTTPVHVAAAWGHQDALELLLAHGGDPFELTDLEGNSAFDLAGKDCSTFLQSVYARQRNSTRFLELSPGSYASLPNHVKVSRDGDLVEPKEKRLEDIVRSNVGLPSFVEENTDSLNIRGRWIQRLRSFRERSSEILKSLRKMGSIRRRSRIGVMVTETPADTLRSN